MAMSFKTPSNMASKTIRTMAQVGNVPKMVESVVSMVEKNLRVAN
jgi:hypothetical protein